MFHREVQRPLQLTRVSWHSDICLLRLLMSSGNKYLLCSFVDKTMCTEEGSLVFLNVTITFPIVNPLPPVSPNSPPRTKNVTQKINI